MDAAKVQLLRSLGQLVRGLSSLFWVLPITLFVDVATARTDWLEFLGDGSFVPALACGAALYCSVHQFRDFQKQERIWQAALGRGEVLAIINGGLAPFLYWWHRFPNVAVFGVCVAMLTFCGILLLLQVNQVLRRLCAMLPDEALREETKMFTTVNTTLFTAAFVSLAAYLALDHLHLLPAAIGRIIVGDNPRGLWLILFMNLMPLAMTLAILWRIKEVIFTSIFEAER
jgi:hypothetical protein